MNYLAILVAAVVAFLVGWFWHSPIGFGKVWMRLSGIAMPTEITPEMKKQMTKSMIGGLIFSIIGAFVVAKFAGMLNLTDAMGALTLAFWLWLGFFVTSLANAVLWEKCSWSLYFFRIAYHLVSLSIVSLIVVLWK